jgi:hypothetical protein
MVLYFLLSVGKYTLPPEHRTTRTVQFRICDISDASILAAASSVKLIMDNQKNARQRSDVTHQEAVNGNFCPVHSTAACVSAIMAQGMPLTTPISFVQPGIHEQPPHILHAVRREAKLWVFTFPNWRAFAAPRAPWPCACPSGHGPEAIMKLGRWQTQTFLTYIHAQIAELTRGTSLKMRQPVLFHYVGS